MVKARIVSAALDGEIFATDAERLIALGDLNDA